MIREGKYKLFCWEPICLQWLNNAKGFLAALSIFLVMAGAMIGGFTNTNIATIERRYGLTSSQSALYVIGYDISFCVLTVFVTYFGASRNRARIVAIGSGMFGIGALLYSLPHFFTPLYQYGDQTNTELCSPTSSIDCSIFGGDLSYTLWVFLVAQLLMGAGATPLYTLGFSYLEDSLPKHSTSLYLGIGNAASLLGSALGFAVGGVFVKTIFVDFLDVDNSNISFDSTAPQWAGAWWIGGVIVCSICLVEVIPLWGFPKYLPGTIKYRDQKRTEVHRVKDNDLSDTELENTLSNFPKAVFLLLRNPTYTIMTLAGCVVGIIISGSASFLPKVIENAFHTSAGDAALFTGAVLVPPAILGHLLGGFLVSKLKWSTKTIIRFCSVSFLAAAAFTPSVLLYCDNLELVGVTVPYTPDTPTLMSTSSNLSSTCNKDCVCDQQFYRPVCADNVTFFSPCHAGCQSFDSISESYLNCSCIPPLDNSGFAVDGLCDSSCERLPYALIIIFFAVFFIFVSNTPALVATFRIVPESLRSFSIGLEWLFLRGLGTIPGPLLFGKFIDVTCVLWQVLECEDKLGSCYVYNNRSMVINFMAILLSSCLLASALYALAGFVYKPITSNTPKVFTNATSDVMTSGSNNFAYEISENSV